MKVWYGIFYLLFLLSCLNFAWAIPLAEQDNNITERKHESLIKTIEGVKQSSAVEANSQSTVKKTIATDDLFSHNIRAFNGSDKQQQSEQISQDKKPLDYKDNEDFLLFDQEEMNAQQEGLELYETLAPMLSPEAKKEAKKLWENSAELRATLKSSDLETETLVLQKASTDMLKYKGKSLEELAGKNLPPRMKEALEQDEEVVHELFVRFFDLLKRAFLIIVVVLLVAKLISILVNSFLNRRSRRSRRKKRSSRYSRKSARRRKKRRRSYV